MEDGRFPWVRPHVVSQGGNKGGRDDDGAVFVSWFVRDRFLLPFLRRPPRRNQAQPVQVVKVKAERSTHGCIRGVDGGEATVTMPLDHWNAGTGHRCDTLRHRVVLVAAVRKRDAAASHRSRSPAATSHHLVSLGCGLSRVLRPKSPKTNDHF